MKMGGIFEEFENPVCKKFSSVSDPFHIFNSWIILFQDFSC